MNRVKAAFHMGAVFSFQASTQEYGELEKLMEHKHRVKDYISLLRSYLANSLSGDTAAETTNGKNVSEITKAQEVELERLKKLRREEEELGNNYQVVERDTEQANYEVKDKSEFPTPAEEYKTFREEQLVREGHIYNMVKKQQRLMDPTSQEWHEMQEIMEFIQNRKPVVYGRDNS